LAFSTFHTNSKRAFFLLKPCDKTSRPNPSQRHISSSIREKMDLRASLAPRMPCSRFFKSGRPDFQRLAQLDKEFVKHFINGKLDFRKESVCISLTKAILRHEFGLSWSIPPGHLCPTIPSRLDYLCWIETLLKFEGISNDCIRGLDIGTGASCIYPLLGAKLFGYSFTATELDEESYQSALKNVLENNLSSQIEVRKVSPGEILRGVVKEGETFHFVMCNPPFFSDIHEAGVHPFRVKTGDKRQMVTCGGEVQFILQMARESLEYKENIRWFTSLVGRKKDLGIIQRYLQQNITTQVRRTCLKLEKSRTQRWIIAWSCCSGSQVPLGRIPEDVVSEAKTKATT